VDLREVVSHMTKMLQRLLGETIRLEFLPPAQIPLVLADTGMVEQIIMNLAVNARDAMPDGGTLTISTSTVEVEEAYAQSHPEARLGSFVCLRVTDTGCGIDQDTMARIFEPFFTTKEVGKGTGLGLATVYGIVKQSGGSITVDSAPDRGTTFRVYLPRAAADAVTAPALPLTLAPANGPDAAATILLAEDEASVRLLASRTLEAHGYRVLSCANGAEALRLADTHPAAIDVLVSDVVMPGMGGPELARRLLRSRPGLRVLYMSGYTDDAAVREAAATGGGFLQKPFDPDTLERKVHELLASRRAS